MQLLATRSRYQDKNSEVFTMPELKFLYKVEYLPKRGKHCVLSQNSMWFDLQWQGFSRTSALHSLAPTREKSIS